MALREIESTLPPGFRFYPSDEELVCHYLHKKVANERIAQGTLVEVDLHAREPWELPDVAKLTATEWYFFSFRDRKYATGSRTNRATKTGYWKATGKDREVRSSTRGAVVGMRKTLVFYRGRAPNGVKSGWVMHEFRLDTTPHSPPREDWVLCRVFQKTKCDGQEGDSASPAFAGTSHAMPPEPDNCSAASSGGYYGDLAFATQQEEAAAAAAVLPQYYYRGTVVDVLPGFGAMMRGDAVGGEYGFGYFDMGGFDDDLTAGLGGNMEFPQVWS